MPNCPTCKKPVYLGEKKTSLGKEWHVICLRCKICDKTLIPGYHAQYGGKPYCNQPCYNALLTQRGLERQSSESD